MMPEGTYIPTLAPLQKQYVDKNLHRINSFSIPTPQYPLPDPIDYHEDKLEYAISSDKGEKNDKFTEIVHSLFNLMSPIPIGYERIRVETSILEWQKQITTAVNQIAMGLRKFVRKLLNDHGEIPVIKEKTTQLRQFAGLNDSNELITESKN